MAFQDLQKTHVLFNSDSPRRVGMETLILLEIIIITDRKHVVLVPVQKLLDIPSSLEMQGVYRTLCY